MATGSGYQAFGFSLSEVLEQGMAAIRSDPVVTLGIAFLFGTLPNLIFEWTVRGFSANAFSMPVGTTFTTAAAVGGIIVGFGALIGQAALMRVTASHRSGRAMGFGEAIGGALRVTGPLLLLIIIMILGLIVGLILLVVPGIILSIMWAVAMPALVIERDGVIRALGRSRQLTAGARWKIFGCAVLLTIVLGLLTGVVAIIGGVVGGLANSPVLLGKLPSAVLQTLTTAYGSTVIASLFLELRDWKDGPETEALSEIFA
ncbi:hypothetical protein [Flavisphingomonas formosensis]|uniref:hypothetical protein n=1 Tax=Flavisphingomonas formosensis TaxID=861534 RepID=UPI0012FC19BF|nr:hypothetical protein [Sphingomonas formosensis]